MEIKYIFCIVFCFWAMKTTMAQSDNNLFALEKQLCFIQDTLSILRQNYPYTDDNYCDSLQHRFSILLEELCAVDKEMKYDFIELRKKERQFTMAVSVDEDMRVFSRNTYFGGSMPLFASYIQYKDKEHLYFFDINEDNDMGTQAWTSRRPPLLRASRQCCATRGTRLSGRVKTT